MKKYLKVRGWQELSDRIIWDLYENEAEPHKEKKGELTSPRSKTFINALKIRLTYYKPEKISTLIKNEAHVRLSSSMWYVSRSLQNYSSVIVFGLLLWFLLISMLPLGSETLAMSAAYKLTVVVQIMIVGSVYLVFRRIKDNVEKFLHYQRVREIFYVLETASAASKDLDEGMEKMFGGLMEPKDGTSAFHNMPNS
ncbi:MAG: hypothetical protein AAF433_13900 [Bacteroidota bacterium]